MQWIEFRRDICPCKRDEKDCGSFYVNKSSYHYLEENEEVRENSYSKEIIFVD